MAMVSSALISAADDELYPSSDGQPMAETELHGDEMTELKLMLRRRFRSLRDHVYVGCNLFIYYEQGNPRAVFSPDVFVVRGTPQRQYDTYKLWQDGPAPCFVIEVSSKKTRLEDRGHKQAVCEMLGIAEYFMYDPRAEYLEPSLQGFRLQRTQYEPIAVDAHGGIRSEALGLVFSLDPQGLIVLTDAASGERLLRVDEEREQATRRANDAETRLREVEAELERLKAR